MTLTRQITDHTGRELTVSKRSVTRGGNSNPSRVELLVRTPSGIGATMTIHIPDGFELYVRKNNLTIKVDGSWSSNTLIANILAAINTVPIGNQSSCLVVVEQSKHTAYHGMVGI